MTKILHSLTLGLNLFCRVKTRFTNTSEGVTLMPSYSIYKPLEIIFNKALKLVFFYLNGKKATSFLFTKTGRNILQNYRPGSLLPIYGKILEQLMFNKMFELFIETKRFSFSQSGFKLGDSCISQLLSITRGIYSSFDEGLEVRSIFLDVTEAFDKVRHDGIIFKLTQNARSGNLLNHLCDFINERKQLAIING